MVRFRTGLYIGSLLWLLVFSVLPCLAQFPFQNPHLSMEQRVDDLVARMTLREKISQMMHESPAIPRLNIPAYNWWNEALHGVGRTGMHVTVFPQAIGLAATFDESAVYKMADMVSDEARAVHQEYLRKGEHGIYQGLTFWTPNINIFRDPRWGRGQETYGEDPYLTGQIGKALVRGFQGEDRKYLKIAACAKHFAIHSGPEQGRHSFNVEISDYDLWDTYLPAFRELVVDAKVAGVMCAYNAYKGQPCCGNDLLMQSILYQKWRFGGYVTSDCGAIDDFVHGHHTSADFAQATAQAVLHGTDLECGNSFGELWTAVQKGLIGEEQIDKAVKRLFTVRFRLGMFDPDQMVKYANIPTSVIESETHRNQALLMAEESIVLLKNHADILPFNKHLKKLAIIGPNADNPSCLLGNYNGTPTKIITPLEGIRSKLDRGTVVYYNKGVDLTDNIKDSVHSCLMDPDFREISDSVKDADAIIFIGGISPALEGEEMPVKTPGFSGGDRTSIDLPQIQTQLLKVLYATGRPVILVMMTGSALATGWEKENLPAIINAWYGGQSGGLAIANVLFGYYNPAGRLPVTFYQSVDQLPSFDNYDMKGRTYRYFEGKPLYPFGYGLSYTNFSYDHLVVSKSNDLGKSIPISIEVQNTGSRKGDEVVQLYIMHDDLKIKRPIRALIGFKRIHLDSNEKETVQFVISPRQLSVVDKWGKRKILPGKIRIFVGSGQPGLAEFPAAGKEAEITLFGKVLTMD